MAASIAQHGPFLAPTGTKLARQHPPRGATGTKLAQQHPTSTPTGTKLTRHTQNRQYLAILDMQGELSLASGASSASRANFLSHQTPLDAAHPYSQPRPLQNSPSNTPPAPRPVQNSPAHTKSAKFTHFGHAGRTFSRSCSNSPQQGELSLASDTTRHNTPILPAPTGTKLTQQHPTSTPTGTKLARHTQNQQNSPILDMQGELSLANPPPG